jgi:tellurite resistance protein TerC
LQQQLDHQFKHRVQPGLQRFGREAVTANSIREMKSTAHYALSMGKKLGIGLVGGLVLLLGIAFIVLPGPAILVIPAGLAILALEFEWARRGLDQFRQRTREFMRRWRSKR